MQVHFIHPGHSYLPELGSHRPLAAGGHEVCTHQNASTVPADARVVWWMCGRVHATDHQRFAQAFQVHEYASASVPIRLGQRTRSSAGPSPSPITDSSRTSGFDSAWDLPTMSRGNSEMGVSSTFLTPPTIQGRSRI